VEEGARGAVVSKESAPLVFCVVVNWNGWCDTVRCVESLIAQRYPALRVVIVDNGSTDDSMERIRAAFPQIEVLEAGSNRGFAAGANVGIRYALERGARFVWLLNNDVIAPPDTLCGLVSAGSEERVGIAGAVLRYMDRPAEIQAWGGGRLVRWMGFVRHFHAPQKLGPNTFLTFASVLLRREMLEQIGLLDEGYFMYFEDSDLCFRARAAGWQLAVAPETAVLHKEGGSGGKKSARLDRIVTASGLRFLGRYGSPRGTAQVLFVLSRLSNRAVHGNLSGMRAVMRGVGDWRQESPMAFQEEP
jgi:GT2 family glycosyltransferase